MNPFYVLIALAFHTEWGMDYGLRTTETQRMTILAITQLPMQRRKSKLYTTDNATINTNK